MDLSASPTPIHTQAAPRRQRVTVEEAPRGHHQWRLCQLRRKSQREHHRRKLADLVVLGRDPLRVDPMSLIDIPSSAL
jgi:hypothetical protein